MSDERTYSDEEFALILRKAAELAERPEQPGVTADGLTLIEMKSAAAQAGYDPALVEQAARMMVNTATPSLLERLIGGPLRHEQVAHFTTTFDEASARKLLSAVRINAHYHSTHPGHSSAVGASWQASGSGDVLSVIARPASDGTTVTVAIDRRGTFVLVGAVSLLISFFAILFSVFALYPEAPSLGIGGLVVGVGGIATAVRSFWSSSTRRTRERIDEFMDNIAGVLKP
jgi:hypothetical protein